MRFLEEWRRSERNGRPKILVLIQGLNAEKVRQRIIHLLSLAFRETDLIGWCTAETTLGLLLLELGGSEVKDALEVVRNKIRNQVLSKIGASSAAITIEFHVVPPYSSAGTGTANREDIFEVLWSEMRAGQRILDGVKRTIDICASLLLLTALSPLLAVIAVCIRMTSSGPAFFRQGRVGFRAQIFSMYKFRTMIVGCDDKAHREYVARFISGRAEEHLDENGHSVFKLTNDQRITRIGCFLRRTSLDELPQLWNVLRGDMSLVGPRPPLPYEVERYELWHRRRVYDLKPGITGLWQVRGRSRCTFDEMTRMDLQHEKPHSLALYFRVLLATPNAVINGHGAH